MNRKLVSAITLSISVLGLSASVSAQQTYTPAQLQGMVQSGNYPTEIVMSTHRAR